MANRKDFSPTDRTRLKRKSNRGRYDAKTVYDILDAAIFASIGFVIDGQPHLIPTAIWREDVWLYIHGSNGSRLIQHLASGAPAVVSVTHLDGLVLARSAFHGSVNYRSVCLYGEFEKVEAAEEKYRQMQLFYEKLVPGRWQDMRPPTANELAATSVLMIRIEEAVAKIRSGPPIDDEADMLLPHWAGVIPTQQVWGQPQADEKLNPWVVMPDYLARYGAQG
ncbi:pyridoxamine 5'-phosphate oxidase family protein [Parvibium lacunae]|uniref:Pyridoxamine 5'-phosphate oxidase family protein n=1 Tax=Parvibium lacunae TaxID=1888893 RepID=A0A368L4G7_9BURK|nr:pyridoxamine 5'-phosphate oxidase family protein [Parvibium lacunae]RCS58050.1 pyridoxamine 5'-phosphate oxidase family protein [Parvibium lacunae]